MKSSDTPRPNPEQVDWLHQCYTALTRLEVPLSISRRFAWENFLEQGHGQPELELVVRFIKRRIKEGRRYPESLRFRNLIEFTENFAEDLSMARAEERSLKDRQDTPRKEIMRAANISIDRQVQDTVRSAAQILAESEALARFREFKKTLE